MKTITKRDLGQFEKNIKAWKAHNFLYDREFVKQYVKDRKDLRMIVSLIKKGNLVMAGRKAWLLDTIVREQIPNKIFNIIDSAWIK